MKSLLFALIVFPVLAAAPAPIAGVWTGTAQRGAQSVPIRLELSGSCDHIRGAWINGPERSRSSSGSFADGHLVLHFDDYANTLEATIQDGALVGTFAGHAHPVAITARWGEASSLPTPSGAPEIGGDWEIQVHSAKHESAWKLHIRQHGAAVAAVVLRVDGDTGNLYGAYQDGRFVLSRFTSAGPSLLTIEPQPDGTLKIIESAKLGDLVARRPALARSDGLAAPDDPLLHTRMTDASQPLQFNFPDLDGRMVANTDARFRGKVVIVAVGGSWCPNCHDEAPFLESLYRAYHRQGLEIVNLSFEEKAQLAHPTRLRAFVADYGLQYPVLLAGEPGQLDAKLPQVEGLDCWPTTFFIGRDGRVKSIHAGFAGPATGPDHAAEVAQTNRLLRALLAQP